MRPRHFVLLPLFLLASHVFAAENTPPHCDAKHDGDFWPPLGKDDAGDVEGLARSGTLKVCSKASAFHYRWVGVTVTIEQLEMKAKPAKAEKKESE